MVDAKENHGASAIISSPKNNDTSALTETTVSSPPKATIDVTVVSQSKPLVEEEEKIGEKLIGEENNGECKNEGNGKKIGDTIEKEDEEQADEEAVEGAKAIGTEKNDEQVDTNLNGVRKSRKRNRRKKAAKGTPKVENKGKDKPESSTKKKAVEKVESMGMIFMCNSKTKMDCYKYKVFGLPANKKDIVQKIYKGMRLFLFDFDLKLMYGIYKAAGPGGSNIEPKAFKSAFPSQVRFTVLEDCLPLAEEKFKKVIKDNYYSKNKFDCQLNSEQVRKLCRLFVPVGNDAKAQNVRKIHVAERHTSPSRGRIRRHDRDEQKGSAFSRKRMHHEPPIFYANEAYPPQMERSRGVRHLPAPASSPLYAYERNLEMDSYRHEPVIEQRGLRLVELEPRFRDDARSRDPYLSYIEREAPSYREAVYTAGVQAEYYSPATVPTEYRREYHSLASLPAGYRSSIELRNQYRVAGISTDPYASAGSHDYRLSAGTLRDYPSTANAYRY